MERRRRGASEMAVFRGWRWGLAGLVYLRAVRFGRSSESPMATGVDGFGRRRRGIERTEDHSKKKKSEYLFFCKIKPILNFDRGVLSYCLFFERNFVIMFVDKCE
jgi:hypothetical protein